MGFRQTYMQRDQAWLGTEANQRETEGSRRPMGTQMRRAHGIEREMPAAALKNAEAQQDGDGTQMGNQQIEKAGLSNFQNSMLRGDQKVGRQGHGLPRQHECVRVIGEQNEAHAGKKQAALQTKKSRPRSLTLPQVACRKARNAGARAPGPNPHNAANPSP